MPHRQTEMGKKTLDETKYDASPGQMNANIPTSCPAMSVTMLYVPIQAWETPYDEQTAFTRGTIFPSLDKPLTGEGVLRRD